MAKLDSKVPKGQIKDKWTSHKDHIDLVNPANKRNIDIIVVGTGLAGGSASATLAGLGYNVKAFCYQDSPRRAHSIAAQGGINAAKNYANDGDSILVADGTCTEDITIDNLDLTILSENGPAACIVDWPSRSARPSRRTRSPDQRARSRRRRVRRWSLPVACCRL